MQLEAEDRSNVRIVRVGETRIDAAIAIRFKEDVRNLGTQGGNRILLDLSAVTFLDSSGLGALVAVMKLLQPERTLELVGLHENVQRVFRLTRMNTVFTIHATMDDALGPPSRLADAG